MPAQASDQAILARAGICASGDRWFADQWADAAVGDRYKIAGPQGMLPELGL
ncbi:hypothetical protein ACT3UA_02940 [Glutamicibacter sp. 363]|uniref:hypothetical protein n=1 Tax=unclassified Glutamicibacter TaxID=2627139 RepID=UPI0015968F42|nr:hypothetical protein [Glutamicibacter sp. BW80]